MSELFRYYVRFRDLFERLKSGLITVSGGDPELIANMESWMEDMFRRDTDLEDFLSKVRFDAPGGGLAGGRLTYGTGADGDVVVSAGTTTLTRDMAYNNLTITGGELDTNGLRVFVKETLRIEGGLIHNNGGNGNGNGTAGAAGGGGALIFENGSAGGAGTTGAGGSSLNITVSLGTQGGVGGDGATGAHGTAGTVTPPGASIGTWKSMPGVIGFLMNSATGSRFRGGSGGGAGGGDGAGNGGGGGGPGGVVGIYAPVIVGSLANIQAKGGNGGSPAAGNRGGGGGGGAGHVLIVTDTAPSTFPTVTAGLAGEGSGTGLDGQAGTDGTYTIVLDA